MTYLFKKTNIHKIKLYIKLFSKNAFFKTNYKGMYVIRNIIYLYIIYLLSCFAPSIRELTNTRDYGISIKITFT